MFISRLINVKSSKTSLNFIKIIVEQICFPTETSNPNKFIILWTLIAWLSFSLSFKTTCLNFQRSSQTLKTLNKSYTFVHRNNFILYYVLLNCVYLYHGLIWILTISWQIISELSVVICHYSSVISCHLSLQLSYQLSFVNRTHLAVVDRCRCHRSWRRIVSEQLPQRLPRTIKRSRASEKQKSQLKCKN